MANESPTIRVQIGTMSTAQGEVADYAYVQFRQEAVRDHVASREAGQPVFANAIYMRTLYPGSTDFLDREIRVRRADGSLIVEDEHLIPTYGKALAEYEANQLSLMAGTPLAVLNLDAAGEAMLTARGIGSVEMLAELADAHLNGVGAGARALRDRAARYLAQAAGGSALSKVERENEDMRAQMQAMADEMGVLKGELAAALAAVKTAAKATPKP